MKNKQGKNKPYVLHFPPSMSCSSECMQGGIQTFINTFNVVTF